MSARYVLVCAAVVALIAVLCLTYEKSAENAVDPKGRGVLITGCDTGLGFSFAQHLDALGFTVFAACLDESGFGASKLRKESSKRMHVIQVDVTKENDINRALEYITKKLPQKGLWSLINNAGMNMTGDVEVTTVPIYEKGFNLNLYGAIRMTKRFLPNIRKTQGRIVNITSVHGRLCLNRLSNYAVAKHALETVSDSLRMEMMKFGVKVAIIEPGMFAAGTSVWSDATVERQRKELEDMWQQASSEVQKTYSKDYLISGLRAPVSGKFNSQTNMLKPVSEAVSHALCSANPRKRYLVDGVGSKVGWFDIYTNLIRVKTFLPTWILDWICAYWRNCDKTT